MAINYTPVGWDTAKYVNPTNMNHMDDGIKAACDGVDAVNENLGYLSDVADYTKMPSRIIGGTSDMNTFTEYGRYGGSAFPSNMTNLPTEISALGANACNFELQVKNIGNQKCQVLMTNAYNANRNYIHVRGINGGSFGEWEYLVKNSDLEKYRSLYNGHITCAIGTNIPIEGNLGDYDKIVICCYARLYSNDSGSTRTFTIEEYYVKSNIGFAGRYSCGGLYYNSDYHCSIGFNFQTNGITVQEMVCNGYAEICVDKVYGIKF